MDKTKYRYDVLFYENYPLEGIIEPVETQLVQNDSVSFDEICFKPYHTPAKVEIEWELISRGFRDSGNLIIIGLTQKRQLGI